VAIYRFDCLTPKIVSSSKHKAETDNQSVKVKHPIRIRERF